MSTFVYILALGATIVTMILGIRWLIRDSRQGRQSAEDAKRKAFGERMRENAARKTRRESLKERELDEI